MQAGPVPPSSHDIGYEAHLEARAAYDARLAALGVPEADRRCEEAYDKFADLEDAFYAAPVTCLEDARIKARWFAGQHDLAQEDRCIELFMRSILGEGA